jgi:aspartyl-tRNA(Asn)/glutamyl-tRNA(Gln) amidotransferase subunit B
MRCDANISINHPGKGLGRKVEIKNLNSSRNVKLALQYEEKRQWKMLKNDELIAQETRLWDDDKKRTESMRSKEDANDYRYFPEPDLPPYFPDAEFLETIEKAQVELPIARKKRFIDEYKLTPDNAEFLTDERARADFYESACSNGCDRQAAASWLKGDIARALNNRKKGINETFLTVEKFAELLVLISENRINSPTAKKVLEIILDEDKGPEAVVKENNWEQLDNSDELEAFVDKVLSENGKAVEQIKSGDMKPVGFIIGQVMKLSGGKADPKKVKEIITGRIT